jgi:mannose-1-phosphate guanylyltransferase/mannose-1-phosphate guanylyltransferase/mannose-6-phosphate isomerase
MKYLIHPVLLCGGSGTRLWPLSRKTYPKQFSPLAGDESLFQASARRLSGPDYAAPTVLANDDYRFIVAGQLAEAGLHPGTVQIEPEGRNTAPAILAAALHQARTDAKALMLVAPSDHVIPDTEAFHGAVATAVPAALAGELVTFGVRPDRPETGFGYLELESSPDKLPPAPHKLKAFVEKPDAKRAAAMLDAGKYLWNAGIFLFTAEAIISAFYTHAP